MKQAYTAIMARKLTKTRPPQGEHLLKLRQAAGLSQRELAELIGENQQNVAFWEQSDKPPRSDVLPRMAIALNVRVEDLLRPGSTVSRKGGPVGKIRKVFEEVSTLPRKQQEKVAEFVSAFVQQYKQGNPSTGNSTNR